MSSEFLTPDEVKSIQPPLTADHVQRITPVLWKMSRKYSRSRFDRDDYVQEALLWLASKSNWNNVIVAAKCAMLNHLKKQEAESDEPVRVTTDPEGGEVAEPYSREPPLDSGMLVEEILAALDPDDRRVAELVFVERYKYQDAADHLKTSLKMINRAVHRIRAQLSQWNR